MATKTFKGTILSLIPKKGFGFISPVWGNGNSNRNIFFVFAETKNGKCYIPALASAENRHEVVSKKGTKIVVPNEPQVLYFNLELGKNDQFVAVNLRDSEHVTPEEAAEADQNIEKPNISMFKSEEQMVNLLVTESEKRPMSLEELEAACGGSKKKPIKQAKPQTSDACIAVVTEPETTVTDNAPKMSIYTEEEIEALKAEDFSEEEEDDIDWDEYEEYENQYGDY